ncbi:DUF6603 domain-containing protein [Streptomyces sp. NPDC057654]|uniref:DUF6603 domain-containing protein n=1 Tax=Streptomyces sp. NPDC057654 TaxID=3346196 RepID=UPI0036893412
MWVVVLCVGLDAGLGDLPVVGPHIPHDADVRLKALTFQGAGGTVNARAAQRVNGLLAELGLQGPALRVPDQGLVSKAQFGVLVRVAGKDLALVAGSGADKNAGKPALGRSDDGAAVVGTGAGAGTLWYPVGRGLGPVRLERLGVRYADKTVFVLVDASVDLKGLTLSGRGMGLGVSLTDPPQVRGALEGLGLAWVRGPVQICGALVVREDPAYVVRVQGGATITLPALSLSAIGGYAQKKGGEPSMFVFGRLAFTSGQGVGPPPFRITGAAAGFGYNSAVRAPALDEVDQFPLMPGTSVPADPLAQLDQLQQPAGGKPWISEARDHIWLAAGIEFDSFRFITGRVLALAQFTTAGKQEFSISLLGRAAADFPRNASTRYAHVDVAVNATYDTTSDTLRVFAELVPGSFLVHPSCHLSGQAALCIWFGASEHPGDFVLSVGGYHPRYTPPAHYPKPKRLQLEWSVSDKVSVRGSCYGALTRSAFMVGAELDLAFHAPGVRASLTAGIDALVQWEPFHYELKCHVEVQVALDFWPYFHGGVGVWLEMWGPPTGGIASVEVVFFRFDIPFGEARPATPQLASWEDFAKTMLPDPLVQAVPVSGLEPGSDPSKAPALEDVWPVSRQRFTFATQSAVPIQQVRLSDATSPPEHIPDRAPLQIRPCGAAQVRSTHRVRLRHEGLDEALSAWTIATAKPVALPEGLWGAPLKDARAEPEPPGDPATCVQGVNGLQFTSPPCRLTAAAVSSRENMLGREWVYATQVPVTSKDTVPPGPDRPGTVRADIAAHLAATHTGRTVLLDLLVQHSLVDMTDEAAVAEDPLTDYAAQVRAHLRTEPARQTKD